MSFPIDLPEKCQKCAKTTVSSIHKNCEFCLDIEFREEVFCDLNRWIQDPREFQCHAFQPILTLVAPSKTRDTDLHDGHQESLEKESIQRFLQSDKIKYQKALAWQKLKDDPNGVFVDVKYHFAWNVIHRKPVFKQTNDTFDFLMTLF